MTYDQLVTRIREYTIDNDAPLIAVVEPLIDDIILRAEERVSKDLDHDAAIITAQTALGAGGYWLDRPAGLIGAETLRLLSPDGSAILLRLRARSYLDALWPNRALAGVPRWYCVFDEAWWRIAPALNAAYTAELVYRVRIIGLAATNPTTWLSINYPELLFKAVLSETGVFHREDGARAMYEADYTAELERVKGEVARTRADATATIGR